MSGSASFRAFAITSSGFPLFGRRRFPAHGGALRSTQRCESLFDSDLASETAKRHRRRIFCGILPSAHIAYSTTGFNATATSIGQENGP
jgi:hypothetical protein